MKDKFKIFIRLILSLTAVSLCSCTINGSDNGSSADSDGADNSSSATKINKYTITWQNYDGTVLEVDRDVEEGSTPSYDGSTPTKPGDAQYSYSFTGWSPEITTVTGDKTYTAQFNDSVNSYTITWDVEGAKTTESYKYGSTPSYKNGTPTKAGNAQYTYTFTGWSPEITAVTGDKTYTAQFSNSVNSYTVTWKNWDGTVLETDTNVAYGSTPSYDGSTPTKSANEQFSFIFEKWSPEVTPVTCNVEYEALFTQTSLDALNAETISFTRNENKPSTSTKSFDAYSSSNLGYLFSISSNQNYTNGFVRLTSGGTFENESALGSVLSINVVFSGGLKIKYGWYYSGSVHYEVWDEVLTSGEDYIFRNGDTPSYILIQATSETYIDSVLISHKECTSFNRYESDGIKCAQTDQYLKYLIEEEEAYISSSWKTTPQASFDVVIRHWYNGRPVRYFETVSFTISEMNSYSTNKVDRAVFATKANSVFIPDTITKIGNYAFYGMSGSIFVEHDEANLPSDFKSDWNVTSYSGNWTQRGGITINGSALYSFSVTSRKYARTYYNSTSSSVISGLGFNYVKTNNSEIVILGLNSNIKDLTIPDTIDGCSTIYIDDSAFAGSSLESIKFSKNVVRIGDKAFEKCSSLKSVDFSSCVFSEIPNSCFSECTSLADVFLSDSVRNIGDKAFYSTSSLKTLDLNKVEVIGCYSFSKSGLETLYFPASIKEIGKYAFYDCDLLITVNFSEANVLSVPESCFSYCSSLSEVVLSSNIQNVSDYAFYKCSALKSFDFSNILTIGKGAFSYTGLENVNIGAKTTSVGSSAFENCSDLITVDFNGNCLIPSYCFSGCSKMINLVIGTNVNTISEYAFEECTNLEMVIIPNSITTLGSYAFGGCSNLSVVVISSNLEGTLYASSFNNCPCKTDVIYFAGSIDEWNQLTISGNFKCVNFYSADMPSDEMSQMLPAGSLFWHYVDGTPTLW